MVGMDGGAAHGQGCTRHWLLSLMPGTVQECPHLPFVSGCCPFPLHPSPRVGMIRTVGDCLALQGVGQGWAKGQGNTTGEEGHGRTNSKNLPYIAFYPHVGSCSHETRNAIVDPFLCKYGRAAKDAPGEGIGRLWCPFPDVVPLRVWLSLSPPSIVTRRDDLNRWRLPGIAGDGRRYSARPRMHRAKRDTGAQIQRICPISRFILTMAVVATKRETRL